MKFLKLAALSIIIFSGCATQTSNQHDNLHLVGIYKHPKLYRYEIYIREVDETLPSLPHDPKRSQVLSNDEAGKAIQYIYQEEKRQAEISAAVQKDLDAGLGLTIPEPPSPMFEPKNKPQK